MTTTEMAQAIGKPVLYESHGLQFVCVVVDIKVSYGQPRFLITPMKGKGETWVEIGTISPMPVERTELHRPVPTQHVSTGYTALRSGSNGMIVR